jgi:hypothetical protein
MKFSAQVLLLAVSSFSKCLPIDLTAMGNQQHSNHLVCFINLIDHSPITDPVASAACKGTSESLNVRMIVGVLLQLFKTAIEAIGKRLIDLLVKFL